MTQIDLTKNIYASNLKSRAVLVMNYLIFRSNKENTCFPSIKTIAKDVHISVNTVKRALNDLEEAGFIKKEARFIKEKNNAQTSNLYTLCEVLIESDKNNINPELNEVNTTIEVDYESFETIAQSQSHNNKIDIAENEYKNVQLQISTKNSYEQPRNNIDFKSCSSNIKFDNFSKTEPIKNNWTPP